MNTQLSQRSFDLADGDRYIIIATSDNIKHAVTRKYRNKPILSKNLLDAKTFTDQASAEHILNGVIDKENYVYTVCQVKDIFEARYFVRFFEKLTAREPFIKCRTIWCVIGEPKEYTYTDYQEANTILTKYKVTLIEYYYRHILALRDDELIEIKKEPR